ncbi:hypothetical protein PEX1_046970 [Penicillium expansum]|uniref:Uncharacterized protein n=1 Tax=Penicillium expansum TaxID=27334 RepID=A0A0A2IS55_PENEN|nr:hypothetical protein PEX2_076550 [Penicillium expansum]KGO45283.1 hypothetical protein PEXP_059030 [Penicillium expansum]KGO56899.1 hypothetical protein PEX2_076550 [Penicillium expansum]KGO66095.1 hypothetical protein PEX1_046970 [Penicillium expansum]
MHPDCNTTPGINTSTCLSDWEPCCYGQINSPAKLHSPHPERSIADEVDCWDIFNKCHSTSGTNISTCISDKAAHDEGENEQGDDLIYTVFMDGTSL